MPHKGNDATYLWDMVEACRKIRMITQDMTWQEFERNMVVRHAIERLIEILGEAARQVSNEFKEHHQEIPWKGIIGQRHVIAHEYAEIIYERIWKIATNRVPELLEQLSLVLKNESSE